MEEEIDRLRAELSHFDGYFFNEVDDLRHNYAEAVKLNVFYEEELKDLSAEHGIPVNIRMDVVDAGEKKEKVNSADSSKEQGVNNEEKEPEKSTE